MEVEPVDFKSSFIVLQRMDGKPSLILWVEDRGFWETSLRFEG